MVRLGSGSGDMKELDPEAIDRGIETLDRFRKIAEISQAKVYAVATSAVREAENADVFIERARREAGIDVNIISGVEEARLIHLGVLQAVPVFDQRLVLVDIGGGSTEVLVGERGEALTAFSLKLGAIRLTRRFFRTDLLHPGAVDACRRYVRAMLARVRREVSVCGFDVAVGSSGTIETIAAMVQAARDEGDEPRTFNNFTFSRREVRRVLQELIDAPTVEDRRRLPGVDPTRADILLAGALILEQTMKDLDIGEMVVSDYALREGVLLDALARERGAALHHLQDLRRRSVVHLMELTDEDPAHSRRVAALALDLFDALEPWHGQGEHARELLEAAGAAGERRSLRLAQRAPQAQLLRDSELRSSDRFHRSRDRAGGARCALSPQERPEARSTPSTPRLDPADQQLVRTLAGILRVAIALDRTHAGLVESVRVHEADGDLVVDVMGIPGADLSLELFTAVERRGLLEDVLERRIKFEEVAPVAV